MAWSVYIILCTDDSLYTGITNNVEQRFNAHLNQRGAKYFRGHTPKNLVYVETGHNRSTASKRECEIKRLKRADKVLLVSSELNQAHLFNGVKRV